MAPLHRADGDALAEADADALRLRNPVEGFGSMLDGIVNAVSAIWSHRSMQSIVDAVTDRGTQRSNARGNSQDTPDPEDPSQDR